VFAYIYMIQYCLSDFCVIYSILEEFAILENVVLGDCFLSFDHWCIKFHWNVLPHVTRTSIEWT